MKYEMIFGDQSLFDGAPEDCVIAVRIPDGEFIFYLENNKSELRGSFVTMDDGVVKLAMRRIIKEPKQWTVEDQKAGVLPEVGAECIKEGKVVTILNVNERYITYINKNDSRASSGNVSINFVNSFLKPIETPAEKAQREEDEFVTSLCKELDGTSLQHDSIYERGVRAAYRRLSGELAVPKGGE